MKILENWQLEKISLIVIMKTTKEIILEIYNKMAQIKYESAEIDKDEERKSQEI